jgi:nucleoside-diphosphate-sugar epimerase
MEGGMRVGLTGGTGYIGKAVAEALAAAGHEVLALAHRPGAEADFRNRGWTPVPGDLRNPESLQELARKADAVIHAAMVDGDDGPAVDTAAVRAMLRALEDSRKPFIYTSGVWLLGPGESDEGTDPTRPLSQVEWRVPLEREVLEYGGRDVRSMVLRPGIVWGEGGGIPGMLGRGEVPVVGDGSQTWPMVHVEDLADLYVRALSVPTGTILHGIHDTVPVARVADVARREAGRTEALIHLTLEEARAALGPFADALALDQRVSARSTLDRTKWAPSRDYPEG